MYNNIISQLNMSSKTKKNSVVLPMNNKSIKMCSFLLKSNLITSFYINYNKKLVKIKFSFFFDSNLIISIKQISRPSRSIYFNIYKLKKLYKVRQVIYILSTSKGIMTNKEALINGLGGKVLFYMEC